MAKNYYKHIVVVHGIGEEQLNETSVNFMNEFCRSLPEGIGHLIVMNLVTRDTPVLIRGASEPAYIIYKIGGDNYYIGFSEVYWQPVTKGYLAAHDEETPVPPFTWAHSINNRLRGSSRAKQHLSVWREAIDNAETLLGLIEKLATVSKQSDLFARIMRDFLGDVQMYAEVDPIHNAVNRVFRNALDDIAWTRLRVTDEDKKPVDHFASQETYIVAHSEGTVVSWKSLMLAASAANPPDWLGEIQGFVTFGSPIDKHHLFWGSQNFPRNMGQRTPKIKWWNFWDYSDPVGHSLEGIFLGPTPENHLFRRMYDSGFARYPIPGVAHVDYWKDTNICHRIIQEVMGIPAQYSTGELKTNSRWWGNWTFMLFGDTLAYALGRAAEAMAMVYFLSRLLSKYRGWVPAWVDAAGEWPRMVLGGLLNRFPKVSDWLQLSSSGLGHRWVDAAIWVLGSAALWKIVWDGLLSGFQDRDLNLGLQFRWERVAMVLWTVILIFAAVNITIDNTPGCPHDCPELKDYTGWLIGLFVTTLAWKIHTTVHKGLLQLWRYGKGGKPFHPGPVREAPVAES